MKAIVNTGPGCVEWQDVPTPEPAKGCVRIKVAACGICATDFEMIDGWERTGYPAIPGHEWSGVVDAVGEGVDAALVGQPCVAENVWADGGEVGFEHPGGYAEYLLTEARNVQPLPAEFPLVSAVLIEPLAVCVRALHRLKCENRSAALVFGDGPIGLIMLMLLKKQGVQRLMLVGGRAARLDLAGKLGATEVLNYHECAGLGEALSAEWPNVVEASGSAAALQAAMDVATLGGKILVIGDYGQSRAEFPWNRLLHKELELIGSNASAEAWPEAVDLAVSGAVPLGTLVSRTFPASDFAAALETARHSRELVKVVMTWE
jgi:threonine dehydrogenase-like Zn-dependent dehydrogenase